MSWHANPTPTTPVHSGFSLSTTYKNVDLSSVVGSQQVMVAVAFHPGGYSYDNSKPADDSDNYYHAGVYLRGTSMGSVNSSPSTTRGMHFTITDEDGVIKMRAGGSHLYDIYVLGWADINVLQTPSIIKDGIISSGSWEFYDLSSDMSEEGVAILKCKGKVANAGTVKFRPADITGDNLENTFDMNGINCIPDQGVQMIMVPTSTSRGINARTTGGSGNYEITLVAWFPIVRSRTKVWPPDPDTSDFPSGTSWGDDSDLHTGVDSDSLAFFEMSHDGGSSTNVSVRPKGNPGDFQPTSVYSHGVCSGTASLDTSTYMATPTDDDGYVEWISSTTSYKLSMHLLGYLLSNTPPAFSGKTPTGSGQSKYVEITVSISDDKQVDLDTVQMSDTTAGGTSDIIIDGVAQDNWDVTITANGSNGYDITATKDGVLEEGSHLIVIYADDEESAQGSDSWSFGVDWDPWLIDARAIGRWNIELLFDVPVKLRALGLNIPEPVDRWTPVTWTGDSDDALNPANYTLTKPPGGHLSGEGESVDLVIVQVKEITGYTEEIGTDLYSDRVEVITDFQHTPRTDLNIVVENVNYDGDVIDPAHDEADFKGYIVSQVARGDGWWIWNIIGTEARRQDAGIGDLETFLLPVQEVLDRLVEDVDAFVDEVIAIDKMRPEIVDQALLDMGNPFSRFSVIFSLKRKRKLLRSLIWMYRQKGTCVGVINAVRFFVGVELEGCWRGWDDTWELGAGTYPTYTYEGDELGFTTWLGPGNTREVMSWWLLYSGSLTADELADIEMIVDYMKPVQSHYIGVTTP